MFKMKYALFALIGGFFLWGCSPKVGKPVGEDNPKQPPVVKAEPKDELSKCPKFSDAKFPDEVENNYVIYRDFLKTGMYDKAFELWQKVYEEAPAADGKRTTVFEDGIWFYKRIFNGEEDPVRKEELQNTILTFFDEMAECYGEKEWVGARKAFDLYYTFGAKDKVLIFNLFKDYIDFAGLKTQAFAINPFTALLVEGVMDKSVSFETGEMYDRKIKEIIAHNLAVSKGKDLEAWQIVDSYAPARLSDLETVKGFYDCAYYKEKYFAPFLENPKDCEVIRETYSWLKWAGCSQSDPDFQKVIASGNENCVEKGCTDFLKEAEYSKAIQCLEEEIANSDDPDLIAKNNLLIAKIYYSYLKNFPSARKFALAAAKVRPNWGEPYLLIGRLYASSGPLCGPGTGWDSQVVTWVAIDMWVKARSVDPAAAAEANKFIARYSKYMPSREDIFQRTLKEGDPFFVPCWIQQSTTVRAAP